MLKVFITLFFCHSLFAGEVGKRISLYSLNFFEKNNALKIIQKYGKLNQNCFFKHSGHNTLIDWKNELSWNDALIKLQRESTPYLIYELKSTLKSRETLEEEKDNSRSNQFLVDNDFDSFKQLYNSKLNGKLFFLYKENSFQNASFFKLKSYVMSLNHFLSHDDFFIFNDQTQLEELSFFIKKVITKKKFQGWLKGLWIDYPISNDTLQKLSQAYYQEMTDKKIVFLEPLPNEEQENKENNSVTIFDYKKAEFFCLKANTTSYHPPKTAPTQMHSKNVSRKKQGQCPRKI